MTPTLAALLAAALLHFATVFTAQHFLTRDIGTEGNVGTREGAEAKLSPLTHRLRRATANFVENVPTFLIAILVISLTAKDSALTAALAWGWVALRALYVVAYARAWVPHRSVIWLASTLCTLGLLGIGAFA
jgi:uncharacterized MAPEG superfamily protein